MSHFPETRYSAVRLAQDADPEVRARGLDLLLAAYWKPVYKHLRHGSRASDEEAQDWTQGFFTRFLERDMLAAFDPRRGSFRNYLRLAADSFVSNERKAARRLKRGGDQRFVSLDWVGAEGELREHPPSPDLTPEEAFEREWARTLFQLALADLQADFDAAGKSTHLRLFERYDLAGDTVEPRPTYQDLAREFSLPVTQVTNFLAATRRRFRELTLERLRAITGSDAEFREEARRLLGTDPS